MVNITIILKVGICIRTSKIWLLLCSYVDLLELDLYPIRYSFKTTKAQKFEFSLCNLNILTVFDLWEWIKRIQSYLARVTEIVTD